MVVTCPQCKVKLKVDDAKIPQQGARFKCPRCSSAIFVKQPEQKIETGLPYAGKPIEVTPSQAGGLDMKKVLIAHGDRAVLQEMEKLVREAGYITVTSQDGIEAIVKASKELPFVAVLDVALPKEYGFDVCKKLKEIEYTKDIKVILITSVYDKTRYKRPPVSLYGADDYIEDHEIRELLIEKIESIKSVLKGEKAAPSPEVSKEIVPPERKEKPLPKGLDSFIPPRVETEKVTGAIPKEPLQVESPKEMIKEKVIEPKAAALSEERGDEMTEKARRLARTIISDIYFYNPQKFEDAVKKGTFYETFQEELKDGLKLL